MIYQWIILYVQLKNDHHSLPLRCRKPAMPSGPSVPEGILRTLVALFADLRLALEDGRLQQLGTRLGTGCEYS